MHVKMNQVSKTNVENCKIMSAKSLNLKHEIHH